MQLLHAASTKAEVAALLEKIENKLLPSKKFKGCNPLIIEFLAAGTEICQQIILNFRLTMEADPLESIREILRFSVLDVSVDDFCAHAIGMAKNQIAALIRAGEKPMIDAGEFRKRLQAFIRKHGALGLLVPTTEQPNNVQIDTMLMAAPVFVQQLMKVNMPQEHVVRAVSDFLRSDADRTLWAAEGRIVEESLYELHDGLEAHFRIMHDEVEDLLAEKDTETRGRQIYRRCITHQAPLEGRSVPSYFIPGTFNMLADGVRVGWHPQYKDFFSGE
ncbi:hypothetical protein FH063_004073 [Azospirillum argentinense]|uniref:ABC-three component systems C-terminal domain-containing protein n=1 Tax=Azospirillum argentinense TaxID=2970906 RepID=A0A5B0KKX9_9PROT|nr:hypothetical protein FH063_004073 [Azospirillum argentinense]